MLSKQELHDLYWVKGQSCVDIGRMVGRDPTTVHSWMRKLGVPTRPRGHNEDQLFGTGKPIPRGWHHSDEAKEKLRQARIADGSKCLFREDGSHVLKGRTGDQHPSWKGGVTPDRQAFYATDEWKDVSSSVWARADCKCERCGKASDGSPRAFHVHHVASFRDHPERRADPENLRLLCAPCHRWVHGRHNTDREMLEGDHARA